MVYQNEQWQKTNNRPPVGSQCLIVEDGQKKTVQIVAHSSFDERAFFGDSSNLKGVFKVSNGFYDVYLKQ